MISKFKVGLGASLACLVLVAAGCGSGEVETAASVGEDAPTIAVTTNILGDVVGELVGDQANVVTIMPVGADPHDFQASAQEVDLLLGADALIVNGSAFEEGILDVIESAESEGVPTFEATSSVVTIEFGEGGHEHEDEEDGHDEDKEGHDDEEEGHDDEEGHDEDEEGHEHEEEEEGHDEDEEGHDDDEEEGHDEDEEGHEHEDEHAHDGADPHFFTDPNRMSDAVQGVAAFLKAEVSGLDEAALDTAVDAYLAELDELDADVAEMAEGLPTERRVLVTNHEVFGYFADQYGFEVVGTVIPSGSTADGASAGELAELAEIIEEEGVPAIFADVSSSDALAETLAAEVGDVEVIELYSESLGESGSDGGTYIEMVRTNASRIGSALS